MVNEWIFMGMYGYILVYMGMKVLYMGGYGSIWGAYGFVWLLMAI